MCGASDAGGQRTEDPWSGRCLPVRRGCSWPGPLEKPHTRDEKLREQRPSRVEPFPCENSLPFDMGRRSTRSIQSTRTRSRASQLRRRLIRQYEAVTPCEPSHSWIHATNVSTVPDPCWAM